ncbi:general stress protein [Bacillus sp. NPDC077027]|uniref:general stress protein n=1 Tax=Bacillus sp. NPDC077027 TaxID=3390548 RepID=UPI003D081272
MSQIYSHRLISLYDKCHRAKHQLYVYSKKTMCRVKNILELEAFRLTHHESDYLIVVEGNKAKYLLRSFEGENLA